MSRIELREITKRFHGKIVLDNISLEVNEGEMITLLGPSGCGKSTTLKIIAGLMEPDCGDIILDGQSVLKVPVEKRGTVMVFQDYLLFPHMTVSENIEFGLKVSKVEKNLMRKKVEEVIDLMGLTGMEQKFPKELSGGQRQRVAIGRAVIVEPRVLLLDITVTILGIIPGVYVYSNLGDKATNIISPEFFKAAAILVLLMGVSYFLKKKLTFDKLQSHLSPSNKV